MTDVLEQSEKLPVKTSIFYGMGELGQGMVYPMVSMFMLFFLSTYAGISPAAVGTLILIARIWDAVNDPIMGTILDNTHSRWGKARPYLLFGAIPFALFFVMIFAVPLDASMTVKLLWSYIAYIGWGMAFTATSISYLSMPLRMTLDPHRRVTLSMMRMIFAGLPAFLVPMMTPILTKRFAGPAENFSRGYVVTAVIYGIISVLVYWVVFFGVKERYGTTKKEERISLFKGLAVFLKSRPWRKLVTSTCLLMTYYSIIMSSLIFYVNFYLKRPEIASLIMPLAFAPSFLAILFGKPLTRKLGKRKVALFAVIVSLAALVVRMFTRDQTFSIFLVTSILTGTTFGFYNLGKHPLIYDAIEYTELKSGVKAESIGLTGDSFAAKLGQGLGPAISGYLL